MIVAEDPATGAEDHRTVPFDECPERQLGRVAAAGRKTLEELAIRERGGYAFFEERLEVKSRNSASFTRHVLTLTGDRLAT